MPTLSLWKHHPSTQAWAGRQVCVRGAAHVMRIHLFSFPCLQLFLLRATQLLPHTRFSDSEHRSMVQLSAFGDHVSSFAVRAGGTLEVTIAQFWSRQVAGWVKENDSGQAVGLGRAWSHPLVRWGRGAKSTELFWHRWL